MERTPNKVFKVVNIFALILPDDDSDANVLDPTARNSEVACTITNVFFEVAFEICASFANSALH
jgi:hypothetical protein